MITASVSQSVCLSRGFTRLCCAKRLNEPGSCLGWRLLGLSEHCVRRGSRSPHFEARGIRCGLRQITLANLLCIDIQASTTDYKWRKFSELHANCKLSQRPIRPVNGSVETLASLFSSTCTFHRSRRRFHTLNANSRDVNGDLSLLCVFALGCISTAKLTVQTLSVCLSVHYIGWHNRR